MAIVDWVRHTLPMKLKDGKRHLFPTLASMVYLSDGETTLTDEQGLLVADKSMDSSKLGGKAPEYYIAPHNLLDNSDFRNPVNQRGATSTTTSGEYIIDRWKVDSNNNTGIVSVGIGGITCNPTNSDYAGIRQNFKNYANMKGKTYTIAVCIGGVWTAASFIMGDLPGGARLVNNVYFFSVDYGNAVIRAHNGETITIEKAAVYEGSYTSETLPLYVPKGYMAELAMCQKYYVQSWDGINPDSNGVITRTAITASRLANVEFPYVMVAKPTITLYTTGGIANAWKEWSTDTVINDLTTIYANSKSFIIVPPSGTLFNVGSYYSGHYSASAEI